jgi:hypothetical protein
MKGLINKLLFSFDTAIPMGIMKNGIDVFIAPSTKLISVFEDNIEIPIRYNEKKIIS